MSRFRDLSPDEQSRLMEAASWCRSLARDASVEQSAAYLAWSTDPRNLSALRAVREGWSTVGTLSDEPEVRELRRQARERLRRREAGRLRALLAASILAITVLAALAIHARLRTPAYQASYETGIGERRIIALPDGSRISMDSDTQVRVTYNEKARVITLDRGRSRFDVAHEPSRPFTVTAGAETVVAVGTAFNVERLPSTVLITLLEGKVLIKTTGSHSPGEGRDLPSSLALKAGQELVVSRNVQHAIVAADLQAAIAWESGHLVFRNEPLGSVVARVNRYAPHPVIIDPSLASLRISGVFNAGDIGSFVNTVSSYLHIEASTADSQEILLKPR